MIKATKQTVNFITEQQPAKKQEIAIQLKNGWFRYDKHAEDSLAGVFLNVYKGELLAVVGGNGSGKTTLLKILARIHTCYAGKLLFWEIIQKSFHKNRLFASKSKLALYKRYGDGRLSRSIKHD